MKNLLTLFAIAVIISITACGGGSAVISTVVTPPTVSASTASMTCTAPTVFRGADDGQEAFAFYTTCMVPKGTVAGSYSAEAIYTLQHDMAVSKIVTWMGTPQHSVQESAGEVTVEIPTATAGVYLTKRIISNQHDKHIDDHGESWAEDYWTYSLPTGTRIHVFANAGFDADASSCPSTGCGLQLNVYLNPQ